ncbi:MAG: hypothetical protein M1813_002237 [Trichoglossum hirsutum]|jgi:hypothetical protein|nr:MAG: hypothetical protein M1813_002237 [Trichoglossum hirsutum]
MVYRLCLGKNGENSRELYQNLINFVEEYLENTAHQLRDRSDDELLASFTETFDRFTEAKYVIPNLLAYLDHVYEGKEDIKTLLRYRWGGFFFPKLQEKLKKATWKMVVKRGNGGMVGHPAVEQIVNSFDIPRHVELRHVFLVTRPLDPVYRKNSRTRRKIQTKHRDLIKLHHWGLLVEVDTSKGTLYEVKAERGVVKPITRLITLRRLGDEGWARCLIGYTLLRDVDIWRYGMNAPHQRYF